jgi:hypothetical protein
MAQISLFCAWLCASGAMLDMAQVVAWTHMFAGYARTESVIQAARNTFDPAKPCALCRAVSNARHASDGHGPAIPNAGSEKIVLILERAAPFVGARVPGNWREAPSLGAPVRPADVPVPPPRGRLA